MPNEFGELPHIRLSVPEDPQTRRKAVNTVVRELAKISHATKDITSVLGSSQDTSHSLGILDRGWGDVYTPNVWSRVLIDDATLHEIITDVDFPTTLREDIPIEWKTANLRKFSHRQALLRKILPDRAREMYQTPLQQLVRQSEDESEDVSEGRYQAVIQPRISADLIREPHSGFHRTTYRVSIPATVEGWNYWIEIMAGTVRPKHGHIKEYLSTENFYRREQQEDPKAILERAVEWAGYKARAQAFEDMTNLPLG